MRHRIAKKSWQDRKYFGYCTFCGSRFRSWLPYDPYRNVAFQASDCASSLYRDPKTNQTLLYGSYGSDFDTLRFFVTDAIKLTKGNVCDECIRKHIETKDFIQDEDFNFWQRVRDNLESRGIPQPSVEERIALLEEFFGSESELSKN